MKFLIALGSLITLGILLLRRWTWLAKLARWLRLPEGLPRLMLIGFGLGSGLYLLPTVLVPVLISDENARFLIVSGQLDLRLVRVVAIGGAMGGIITFLAWPWLQHAHKRAVAGLVSLALWTLIVLGVSLIPTPDQQGIPLFNLVRDYLPDVSSTYRDQAEPLRQLHDDLIAYTESTGAGHLPSGTIGPETLPPDLRLSWIATLVDERRQDLGEPPRFDSRVAWNDEVNRGAANQPLDLVRGPHLEAPGRPGQTRYVGLAGVGVDAPYLDRTHPRAGAFGYRESARLEMITDGLAETALVIESAWLTGPWAAGGPATVRGLDLSMTPAIGLERPFGSLHRLNSYGALTLFADGSVRLIRPSVDTDVLAAHITIHGPKTESRSQFRPADTLTIVP